MILILKCLIGSAIGCMIYISITCLIKSILAMFSKDKMDKLVEAVYEDENLRKYGKYGGKEGIKWYLNKTLKVMIIISIMVLPLLIMLFIWVMR